MQQAVENNILIELFKKYKTIGVVGNADVAKSSLVLNALLDLKTKVNMPIYILGAEECLYEYLQSKGINIIYSVDDILDLKIKGAIIYIDEFADIFDVKMASKQTERIRRFFNRLAHLNDYVIISTAQTKFWNVFMCSLVKAYLVKQIEFDALVNGTLLKRKVQNISENTSEYRLDIPINTYYTIEDKGLVEKRTFEYNENIDSKKGLVNPFKNLEINLEENVE